MLKTMLITAALAAGAANAMAAADSGGATIPPGARLAATCAACHGTNGATVGDKGGAPGATMPPLAGQPKQALSAALHDFKTGKRQATIMTQIAKGYSDEQIEQLAAWFSAQRP